MPLPLSLSVRTESWPIAGAFSISRGAKTEAQVVVAELSDGRHKGRGECVPYVRYDETVAGVMAALQAIGNRLAFGLDRMALQQAMPAGAARNALDCAFWDLEAKRAAKPVYELAGLLAPEPLTTAYTISLGTPQAMADAARAAAPHPELIVDANEGWTAENLVANLAACAAAGVTLVEQPLPATTDSVLASIRRPIPVCADESVHDRLGLAQLVGRYDAVNIKLDKTGGLTEALAMTKEAQRLGFDVMVGAAWLPPRSPWRPPCWWRRARAWS